VHWRFGAHRPDGNPHSRFLIAPHPTPSPAGVGMRCVRLRAQLRSRAERERPLREREAWFFIYIKRSSRVTRVAEKHGGMRGAS